jgi:hypothetical protein
MTRFIVPLAICVVACAAACGDSSSNDTGDLATATAHHPLSGTPKDLASGSCAVAAACVMACDPAALNVCIPDCLAGLDAAAMSYFNALELCAQPACAGKVDGGLPPCASPGSAACGSCLSAHCGSQLSACLAH